jgi:hypothetical protein
MCMCSAASRIPTHDEDHAEIAVVAGHASGPTEPAVDLERLAVHLPGTLKIVVFLMQGADVPVRVRHSSPPPESLAGASDRRCICSVSSRSSRLWSTLPKVPHTHTFAWPSTCATSSLGRATCDTSAWRRPRSPLIARDWRAICSAPVRSKNEPSLDTARTLRQCKPDDRRRAPGAGGTNRDGASPKRRGYSRSLMSVAAVPRGRFAYADAGFFAEVIKKRPGLLVWPRMR